MKIRELLERKEIINNKGVFYIGDIEVETILPFEQLKRKPFFHIVTKILSADPDSSWTSYDDKKAMKLVKLMGIGYHDVDPTEYGLMWDGKKLSVQNLARNVVHDVAHWQLAHKDRRPKPEFGLGPGPETSGEGRDIATSQDSLSPSASSVEESEASLLGILWELFLGIGSVLHTFIEHSWVQTYVDQGVRFYRFNYDSCEEVFYRLVRLNMVDLKGTPTLYANVYHEYANK